MIRSVYVGDSTIVMVMKTVLDRYRMFVYDAKTGELMWAGVPLRGYT